MSRSAIDVKPNWSIGRLIAAVLMVGLAGVFTMVVVRSAWVGDDAYITFRTIDNFLNGYGLRWNVAERVQSYTHPLWLILLTPVVWLLDNPFTATIVLSLVCTCLAVGLVMAGVRGRPWETCFVLVAVTLSKSFTDYTTSGLENTLSHALLAALMLTTARPVETAARAGSVGLLVSLTSLTRLDLTLLAWPIGLAALRAPRRTLPAFIAGQAPLVVWEIFSVIYYGVPFPNTAYAKLGTGIAKSELAVQGFAYFTDSLVRDPVTLFIIMAGVFAGVVHRTRSLVPALGVLAYLAYVVRIGGDFMSGRFFSAPFLVSLCLLTRVPWPAGMLARAVPIAATLMIGLAAPRPTIFNDHTYQTSWQEIFSPTGIVDERGFYFQERGWLTAAGFRTEMADADNWRPAPDGSGTDGTRVFTGNAIGAVGYYTGPDYHIIDLWGLSDPLIARMPAVHPWRIGHFPRGGIPAGYRESVIEGRNLIEDPDLARLYDTLVQVTQAPIWSAARWKAIVALNTKQTP